MKFNIKIDDDSSNTLKEFSLEQNQEYMVLYDWQRRAIDFFFKNDNSAIFEVCTGAGKTVCAITILKEIFKRDSDVNVLIVVPKNVILETGWWKELYNQGFTLNEIGAYYGKIKEYGSKITITNMQNLGKIDIERFNCLVADECFIGKTEVLCLIDNKYQKIKIEKIVKEQINYKVLSYNIKEKKLENKKIINWYEINEDREVIELILDDNKKIIVTPEQLIYTKEGYKKACELNSNDNILVI